MSAITVGPVAPPRRSKKRLAILLGLLIVALGVYVSILVRHRVDDGYHLDFSGISFGGQGPAKSDSGSARSLETVADANLAGKGIGTDRYCGMSLKAESSLFWSREERKALVRISTARVPVEKEGLSYTLYGENDHVVGEGKMTSAARIEPGQTGQFVIQNPRLADAKRIVLHE